MEFIRSLNQVQFSEKETFGARGCDLAKLLVERVPIPPTFILTSSAWELFVKKTGLRYKIDFVLKQVDIKNEKTLINAFNSIRKLIISNSLPQEVEAELKEAYESLGGGLEIDKIMQEENSPNVLMIASPTYVPPAESFEGMIQNIHGFEQVLLAVKEIYATAFTPEAITYQAELKEKAFSQAVIIQGMPGAIASATAYSSDPKHPETVFIHAYLGYTDMRDVVAKDFFHVKKEFLNITATQVVEQSKIIERKEDGELYPLEFSGRDQSLNDKDIMEIGRLAKKSEKAIGCPVKLFFTITESEFLIMLAGRYALDKEIQVETPSKPEEAEPEAPPVEVVDDFPEPMEELTSPVEEYAHEEEPIEEDLEETSTPEPTELEEYAAAKMEQEMGAVTETEVPTEEPIAEVEETEPVMEEISEEETAIEEEVEPEESTKELEEETEIVEEEPDDEYEFVGDSTEEEPVEDTIEEIADEEVEEKTPEETYEEPETNEGVEEEKTEEDVEESEIAEDDEEYEYVDEEDAEADETEEEADEDTDESDDENTEEENDEDDSEEGEDNDEPEDDEEYEYVDEDGKPIPKEELDNYEDADETEEADDEDTEEETPEEDDDEEYEYVDEDGKPIPKEELDNYEEEDTDEKEEANEDDTDETEETEDTEEDGEDSDDDEPEDDEESTEEDDQEEVKEVVDEVVEETTEENEPTLRKPIEEETEAEHTVYTPGEETKEKEEAENLGEQQVHDKEIKEEINKSMRLIYAELVKIYEQSGNGTAPDTITELVQKGTHQGVFNISGLHEALTIKKKAKKNEIISEEERTLVTKLLNDLMSIS